MREDFRRTFPRPDLGRIGGTLCRVPGNRPFPRGHDRPIRDNTLGHAPIPRRILPDQDGDFPTGCGEGFPVEAQSRKAMVSAATEREWAAELVCLIRLRWRKGHSRQHKLSLWRRSCGPAACSKRIGTLQNIHAGRPEVPMGSAENSPLPAAMPTSPRPKSQVRH
jgi:hypothetical protein